MAIDKAIDSNLLDAACTYEAGKIREKLGSSAQIAYDLANGKGFGDAIAAIPSGGGDTLADLLSRSVVTYENNSVQNPLWVFEGNTGIKNLTLGAATTLNGGALNGCTNLEKLNLPSLTALDGQSAIRATKLTALSLPKLSSTNQRYVISYNTSLAALDFAVLTSLGGDFALEGNSALTMLVLRRTAGVVTLGNVNRFNSTPFASGGAGGTLYVWQSLVTQYTQATNWSTILGYTNNQIKSIESTHTDPTAPIDLTLYYADGTPIT